MKAAVHTENGAPTVLRYTEIADPPVGDNDVLIRVEAVSIEGGDVLSRRLMPVTDSRPRIPGISAAGAVAATGSKVTRVQVGQRVAAFNWGASHAELWSVPEHYVYPIPDEVGAFVAATVPVAFGTADDALFDFGRLQAGETVLVRGATGGVGVAVVQLARAAGAVVIATASSDSHAERLARLGADHVINYRVEDVVDATLRLTGGAGIDLLVELAGGPGFDAVLATLKLRGRISVIGAASGDFRNVSFMDLGQKMLTVAGVSFGQEMHQARVHEMIQRHFTAVRNGELEMPIDRVFSLADAAAAHHHVETAHPFGRVIMAP